MPHKVYTMNRQVSRFLRQQHMDKPGSLCGPPLRMSAAATARLSVGEHKLKVLYRSLRLCHLEQLPQLPEDIWAKIKAMVGEMQARRVEILMKQNILLNILEVEAPGFRRGTWRDRESEPLKKLNEAIVRAMKEFVELKDPVLETIKKTFQRADGRLTATDKTVYVYGDMQEDNDFVTEVVAQSAQLFRQARPCQRVRAAFAEMIVAEAVRLVLNTLVERAKCRHEGVGYANNEDEVNNIVGEIRELLWGRLNVPQCHTYPAARGGS